MQLFQSFRAARWLRSTNLILQAVLFVTLFAGLNYLAFFYSWRFDLTQLRRHSLSAETGVYLSQINQPIRVIVTFPKDDSTAGPDAPADLNQINNDIAGLLREYAYAIEANPRSSLKIEYIDVYQRPREAAELQLEPYRVVFFSGEPGHLQRRKDVLFDMLYQYKNNQRVAFLGEQAFTAAILYVCNPVPKKIYFLTGHGEEMDLNSVDNLRGLSELRDALRGRNYELDTLNLSRVRAIPDDAELIVSIGAQNPYEPYEEELLRKYLSVRAKRIMLFAQPGVARTGLESLLSEWGIVVDDDWIYDPGQVDLNGDLVLTADNATHAITQVLADNHLAVKFGATRSVRPATAQALDPGLSVTPLIFTSNSAWGEISYRAIARRAGMQRYDAGADRPGPLPVATASERMAAKNDLPFSIPVGRIAVFGCADFLANSRFGARANSTVFFSTLNWAFATETQYNIPARPIEKFQLALGREELSRLRITLLFGVPGAVALLGLIVYWTRRR